MTDKKGRRGQPERMSALQLSVLLWHLISPNDGFRPMRYSNSRFPDVRVTFRGKTWASWGDPRPRLGLIRKGYLARDSEYVAASPIIPGEMVRGYRLTEKARTWLVERGWTVERAQGAFDRIEVDDRNSRRQPSCRQTARAFGVSESTARRWLRAELEGGTDA